MIDFDDPATSRSYRTTKEAYGVWLYVEKKNHDWAWTLGAAAFFVAIAVMVVSW